MPPSRGLFPRSGRYPERIDTDGARRGSAARRRSSWRWPAALLACLLAAATAPVAAHRQVVAPRPVAAAAVAPSRRAAPAVRLAVAQPDARPLAARTAPDLVGAGSTGVEWRVSEHTLIVGDAERTYRLVRPAKVGPTRLRVLVVLHGRNMTPAAADEQTRFESVAGPAILVFPAGVGESWNAGACCGEAHATDIDDVGFVTEVVRHVLAAQTDASDVVDLVGYSNGGRMAYRLACAEPKMFAAVATVEAAPVYACPKPPAVPLLLVGSTADPLLRIESGQPAIVVDGYTQPALTDLTETWSAAQGCLTTATRHPAPALAVRMSSDCATFSPVGLAVYQGGSHAWPEGDATTPSAQRTIWGFFTA